jgi:hypothetical protein
LNKKQVARAAGGSVKPGVERSGTPGKIEQKTSKPAERAAAVELPKAGARFAGFRDFF